MTRMHAVQQAGRFALAATRGAARLWARAVRLTGARGGAWIVGGLIIADAVLVARCTTPGSSFVADVLSGRLNSFGETGCWFPNIGNTTLAKKDAEGKWCVRALAVSDFTKGWPDAKVQIVMGSTRFESYGILSPWLVTEHGRFVRFMWLDGFTDDADDQTLRQALIDAWPALAAVPGAEYAQTPLRPDEIDGIKADREVERTSINWLWLANDVLVLTAGVLLCGSQPIRSARWRENARKRQIARKQLVEFRCSACRYALGGLPMSSARECRCPECGRVNIAV